MIGSFGGEQGRINPPEVLEAFRKHEPIPRDKCRSYEAYMLQYLSWIFDLNLSDSLQASVSSGMISKTLRYLKSRLSREEYGVIEDTIQGYVTERGLGSIRGPQE